MSCSECSNSNYITIAAQACYLIVIVYALYPIVLTAERLSKRNYENIANEFEFTKKSLFVALTILVILVIIALLLTNLHIILHFILNDVSLAILAASLATAIGSICRISAYTARKDFRFYLARGYCRISSEKKNNFDKIKYLFLSLDSYNKFLVRKTKFGIKNIGKIYSDIMHNDARKNDEMIKSINEHLGGQGMDLAIYLSKIYEVSDKEQFFVKESLLQKSKTIAAFLAAAIPIIISTIKLIAER
jgi:hypothetical protein